MEGVGVEDWWSQKGSPVGTQGENLLSFLSPTNEPYLRPFPRNRVASALGIP